MPNQVRIHNPFSQEIDEVNDAIYLFTYAECLKKKIMDCKGDKVNSGIFSQFCNFLYDSNSKPASRPDFSRFLTSKFISDKYKKDFVVDIALSKPNLIDKFIHFDVQELKRTTDKDTAVSAGEYLIKELTKCNDGIERPILTTYIYSSCENTSDVIEDDYRDDDLSRYSYARAIAETGKQEVEKGFIEVYEENYFNKFYLPSIKKYKENLKNKKNSPQESTKEELEAKIRFMNELRKEPDNAEYLALYLCDKEKNDGQKSLLAEIVDFGIDKLEPSMQTYLKDILTTANIRNRKTLLEYYSENSTDPKDTKDKVLQDLKRVISTEEILNGKLSTLKEFTLNSLNSLNDQKDLVSYLCDTDKNGDQKSLLAEIVDFGIDKLDSSNRDFLKGILTTPYTEDEQILLEYYSENSTDSEEIKAETSLYLREFLYVDRYYLSEKTKEKLEKKIDFMKEYRWRYPGQREFLASYLCDKDKNDDQKSLLAEIVDFGINNLKPSDQDTLKEILNTVRTKNGKTLLEYYSENSTDSGETKAKTSFYLREFQDVGRYYSLKKTKEKLEKKINFMEKTMKDHSDQIGCLASYLCDKDKNGGNKSLLTEIVDFGINNLEPSVQNNLKNILTTANIKYGHTLLEYYNTFSTDSGETKAKTSIYFRTKEKLERTLSTLEGFVHENLDNQKNLAPYLCDKEKNDDQKSLLAEIVDFGIDKLDSSNRDFLKGILTTPYTEDEQTLLEYYSENSTDSGETKAKTSFYLREFQDVGRYYSPKKTKEKLEKKINFIKKPRWRYPGQIEYLTSYLYDKKQNGGQKSLLAEIVDFGIDKLDSSMQNNLKNILTAKNIINGKTLLECYSKNSTDSDEIKAETSFYLREFLIVDRYYPPEKTKEKLEKKIDFMKETMNYHPDQIDYLRSYLCDTDKNGGQKSLLAEIVDFGIDKLDSSKRDFLKGILTAANMKYKQTLSQFYNMFSTDLGETRVKTFAYLQAKEKLERKLSTLGGFIHKNLDDQKDLVPRLCDKDKNGGQKSLLAEIVDFGIDKLEPSMQTYLKDILTTANIRNGKTLLEYYSENSTDSKDTKDKVLQDLKRVISTEEILNGKLSTLKEFIPESPDDQKDLVSYLCDKEKNGDKKSLLAEIAEFGINNLEDYNNIYLRNLLGNTEYTSDYNSDKKHIRTLLEYYSQNSTDSKETKRETLNKLQNFIKVAPRVQPPERRFIPPYLGLLSLYGISIAYSGRRATLPGLEKVSEVNGSDDTVKTPKDINKAPRDSDTKTINKGNGGRSFG